MLFGANGEVTTNKTDEISLEAASMIMEAAMLDSLSTEEIIAFLENTQDVNDALQNEILEERSIVRLDKKARMSHAVKMAEFEIAKEKNDKNYRKLLTVWKMEKELEEAIHKKYNAQAQQRAKKTVRGVNKSISKAINKASSNLKKDLNPEIKQKGSTKPVKPMSVGSVPLAKIK